MRAAIDAHPHETGRSKMFEKRFRSLTNSRRHWSKQEELCSWIVFEQAIDHRIDALCTDWNSTIGAQHHAESCRKHSKIVIHLGERANRRPRRVAGVLLFDSNRRRESINLFKKRLRYMSDKLPGIGTQAFNVSSLAFGVERIHGQ